MYVSDLTMSSVCDRSVTCTHFLIVDDDSNYFVWIIMNLNEIMILSHHPVAHLKLSFSDRMSHFNAMARSRRHEIKHQSKANIQT